MNPSEVNKIFNNVQNAIDVPLMDIYNVSTLIMDTLVSVNKYFVFTFGLQMYEGIPHYIHAIILAENENNAFEILKYKLNTIKVDSSSCYDPESTFEDLTFEDFDVNPLHNNEHTILCEPRIEYLLIDQGYWDGSSSYGGLTYTLCEYKHKCKPQKEYVNIYEDRNDYFNAHTYYPDERIETEYNADNVEIAQSYIQYLF